MSGIVGMLTLDGAPVDTALLKQMTDRMGFRGPDAQATWAAGSVGLGHALLRTTFESAHEQGPCSLDGQVWIAADARVDARSELIHELRAKDRDVADDAPDPTLILHAYHVWEDACLDHLLGDFAFAIWDGRTSHLLCARDQVGMVPFYYAHVNDCLTFGNTLQAIRLHPDISDTLNEQAVGDYLIFRANQNLNSSTFIDIQRLPPAHLLTWTASDGSIRVQRYWDPPDAPDYLHLKHPEEYVERFSGLLHQAVADRLRTDRVTVAMSGGMDSPSVAAVAHSILSSGGRPFQLRALTHLHTLIPSEERHYAGKVAKAVGFPIEYIDVDARLLDPPAEDPHMLSPELSPLLTWWLGPWLGLRSRAADAGRVLLDGFGGDPGMYLLRSYWLDLLKARGAGKAVTHLRHYSQTYGHRAPLFIRWNLRRWLGIGQSRPEYPPWINSEFADRLHLEARFRRLAKRHSHNPGWRSVVRTPFWSNLVSSLDPGNTLLPLETRSPLLDLRLLRYIATLPPTPWFLRKHLLREALRDDLPEAVLKRPKTVLPGNPLRATIIARGVPHWLEELAAAPELTPYIDTGALLATIRSPQTASDANFMRIMRPVTLSYWLTHRKNVNEGDRRTR